MRGPTWRALVDDRGADGAGHTRAEAVGPDDESGRDLDGVALGVVTLHAGHPGAGPGDAGHGHARAHLRPGLSGGLDQEVVEDVAAGRDQEVDA